MRPIHGATRTDNEKSNEAAECCIIDQLLDKSFAILSFQDKQVVINKDRPTSNISISTKIKIYIRHFKTDYYNSTKWLTDCEWKSRDILLCVAQVK